MSTNEKIVMTTATQQTNIPTWKEVIGNSLLIEYELKFDVNFSQRKHILDFIFFLAALFYYTTQNGIEKSLKVSVVRLPRVVLLCFFFCWCRLRLCFSSTYKTLQFPSFTLWLLSSKWGRKSELQLCRLLLLSRIVIDVNSKAAAGRRQRVTYKNIFFWWIITFRLTAIWRLTNCSITLRKLFDGILNFTHESEARERIML